MSLNKIIKRRFDKEMAKKSACKIMIKKFFKNEKIGSFGLIITIILLIISIFANVIAPYGMNEADIDNKLQSSSSTHLFGTDNLGRDILSRIIYGAQVTVVVGFSASLLSTVISVILGLFSGYFGGKFDLIIQRVVDLMMAFPSIILLIALMSILGTGVVQLIIVLGLRSGIVGSRLIRSAVIDVKENVFVDAANAIGCSNKRILLRHILPHIISTIIILFTTRVPNMVMVEASLSFLGFGIPAPFPSWGGMLSSGREFMIKAPFLLIWPGLALSIVVFGINMLGDSIRDLIDPRMKGIKKRKG